MLTSKELQNDVRPHLIGCGQLVRFPRQIAHLPIVLRFRDTLDKLGKVYGQNPNRFKYEKAPPRGRLEGIRDFTDKEITVQYHDDGTRSNYEENFGKNFPIPEYQWPRNL